VRITWRHLISSKRLLQISKHAFSPVKD